MGGPRISSGTDSKQDYQTPAAFMAAVTKRFGAPIFDLAAHAGNTQSPNYFAPVMFQEKVERGETDFNALINALVARGAEREEAHRLAYEQCSRIAKKGAVVIPNRDAKAFGFDAFAHNWHTLHATFGAGPLWNNCEFSDITPWATKHAFEAKRGANSLLLTPAVFANWYRDHIAGIADVYELSGRLNFDGTNVFPKDCRLSHFHPAATGKICIWEWSSDTIHVEWQRHGPIQ